MQKCACIKITKPHMCTAALKLVCMIHGLMYCIWQSTQIGDNCTLGSRSVNTAASSSRRLSLMWHSINTIFNIGHAHSVPSWPHIIDQPVFHSSAIINRPLFKLGGCLEHVLFRLMFLPVHPNTHILQLLHCPDAHVGLQFYVNDRLLWRTKPKGCYERVQLSPMPCQVMSNNWFLCCAHDLLSGWLWYGLC